MNLTWESEGVGHYYRQNSTTKWEIYPVKVWFWTPVNIISVSDFATKYLRKNINLKLWLLFGWPGARPGVWLWCWKQWLIFPKRNVRRRSVSPVPGSAAVTQPVRAGCAQVTLTQFFFPRPRSCAPKLHQPVAQPENDLLQTFPTRLCDERGRGFKV